MNRFLIVSLVVWTLLTSTFIVWKGVVTAWNGTHSDFNNYYVASCLLMDGERIETFYDNQWFQEKAYGYGVNETSKFAPFTPLTAYLLVPLTNFDLLTARKVWLCVNLILLVILPFRIKKLMNFPLKTTLFFLSIFFIPISSNLHFGQVYLVIVFISLELLLINQRKSIPFLTGSIVSLMAMIKYIPILYLMFLPKKKAILSRYTKVLLGIFVSAVIVIFILEFDANRTYLQVLVNHLQGNLSGQGKYAVGFQSIDSLLNNLFVNDKDLNPIVLFDLPLLKPLIKSLFFLLIIAPLILVFRRDKWKLSHINASLTFFAFYTLFPASASYHFLFLIPPSAIIIKRLLQLKAYKILLVVSTLLVLSFSIQQHHIIELKNAHFINLIIHYPRLWMLLLLYITLLWIIKHPRVIDTFSTKNLNT